MKTILSLILCVVNFFSAAQTISIPEPEFSNTILYAELPEKGVPLEHQTVSIRTPLNASYFIPGTGVTVKNTIEGCCASVKVNRLKAQFIVRIENNTQDPSTIIKVFQLASKKKSRYVETKIGSTINSLSFTASKYGQVSYLIELTNLNSGQYAISLPNNFTMFYTFAVE